MDIKEALKFMSREHIHLNICLLSLKTAVQNNNKDEADEILLMCFEAIDWVYESDKKRNDQNADDMKQYFKGVACGIHSLVD